MYLFIDTFEFEDKFYSCVYVLNDVLRWVFIMIF